MFCFCLFFFVFVFVKFIQDFDPPMVVKSSMAKTRVYAISSYIPFLRDRSKVELNVNQRENQIELVVWNSQSDQTCAKSINTGVKLFQSEFYRVFC